MKDLLYNQHVAPHKTKYKLYVEEFAEKGMYEYLNISILNMRLYKKNLFNLIL